MIGSMGMRIRRKAIMNLLKPGNTKGAAAFCVVINVVQPSRKSIATSKGSLSRVPVRRQRRFNVDCLPRRTSVFHGVAM